MHTLKVWSLSLIQFSCHLTLPIFFFHVICVTLKSFHFTIISHRICNMILLHISYGFVHSLELHSLWRHSAIIFNVYSRFSYFIGQSFKRICIQILNAFYCKFIRSLQISGQCRWNKVHSHSHTRILRVNIRVW